METNNNIPKISTRQTEYLRDRYPNVSYLEAGKVAEWLQERTDQLLEQAQETENEADTARLTGLIAAGVGSVCYATNPFMLIGGILGGAAWLWFILEHHQKTKEISPIPFVRGSIIDAISRAGDYDARQGYEANHLAETIKFLPRRDAQELVFLNSDFLPNVVDYLLQVEPGKRFYAYRWILMFFEQYKGRAIPDKSSLDNHLEQVEVDSRVKTKEVEAIQQHTPRFVTVAPSPNVVSIGKPSHPELQPATTTKQTMVVDVYEPSRPQDFDLCDRMGKDATSHLIVGVPGSGKGLTTSNSLLAIQKHHPEIHIFYVDPKNDVKETGYFTDRVHTLRRANVREMSPSAAVEWFKDCIRRFEDVPGDKLLVFDESTIVSSKFKLAKELDWLKDKLIGYASCGDSIGLRIWIIAQNAHTDDLGINGGIRSQFVPIAIISKKNVAALGALFSTQFIPKNQKLDTDEVETICTQSPVSRAVYHGGENKWYPMKRLPNPSGYDRDSREFLKGVKPVQDAIKVEAEVVETSNSTPMAEKEDVTLTDDEQMLLSWIVQRKTTGREYDLNTANKNLEKLVKPDDFDSKAEYLRHLARQLKIKNKGTLVNPNVFEPN